MSSSFPSNSFASSKDLKRKASALDEESNDLGNQVQAMINARIKSLNAEITLQDTKISSLEETVASITAAHQQESASLRSDLAQETAKRKEAESKCTSIQNAYSKIEQELQKVLDSLKDARSVHTASQPAAAPRFGTSHFGTPNFGTPRTTTEVPPDSALGWDLMSQIHPPPKSSF
ncbi:MAG: hypothetical protein Q9170_003547 [Blastenia crenularia]